MFHLLWLALPCILSPFLLVVVIIVGFVKVDKIVFFFLFFFDIYKFFSFKLLLCIAMFSEGLFFSVMSAVTFDYGTKICVTVIYCFQKFDFCIVISEDFDIQTQRLKLFKKNFEGFRDTWLRDIVTFDNCFVSLHTTYNIIGLHCQDLLQSVGSTICLQRPNLHLSETLSTELSFTTQRLLCYQ